MASSLLSKADQSSLLQLRPNLPHALLIVGEKWLDNQGAIDYLTDQPSVERLIIKPIEKTNTITIDQVRQLLSEITTQAINLRIIIIESAQLMKPAAQSAMLKVLEEPNPQTVFILSTDSLDSILPTIRSRCQIFQLTRTQPAEDKLQLDQLSLEPRQRQQIQFLAAGRPMLIERLARDSQLLSSFADLAADAKILISSTDSLAKLATVRKYSENRQSALSLIDILLSIYRSQLPLLGYSPEIKSRVERAIDSQRSIEANGNLRLSLLHLVI